MNIFKKNVFLFLLLMPFAANAIGINAMIQFADKNDDGSFTVTNSESYRQFIQVAISSVTIENGELVKTAYTRENIADWSLTVRPARTVIDPGLQKDFTVKYEPKTTSSLSHDQIYQLTFVPLPYFAEGEASKKAVQVAVGFAPIYVVPAETDQPLDYNMSFTNNGLRFVNKGGTYIRALLDTCETKKTTDCTKVVYVLSGRDLMVSLSPEMQAANKIKVELSTHNLTYKKNFVLLKGKTVQYQGK
ncbi:hypothetical protein E1100_00020 [Vibrio owensii]|uniref:hypothetical protein n=1 Tax=Vibrio owensii TaxID=696485 RepID=UPI0010444705|nr:hypothetical protein [Vibrio owensii]TDE25348.1 hypothetical protein E1100_00020 [Vibrio owensii]